ncbi:MAG: hypothetical protein SX243_10615 [Acidobacteriota bacterium]|nr:hypothetical protein [Acidobacteriota bacterium]
MGSELQRGYDVAEIDRREAPPAAEDLFLDYVAENPACVLRSSYSALDQPVEIAQYPLQSWPAFIDSEESQAHRRAVAGLTELVLGLPQSLLQGDPAALADVFRLDSSEAAVIDALLKLPGQRESLLARGDFIEDSSGTMQCLELNVSSNLGGWQNVGWAELYRRIPVLQDFFGRAGTTWNCVNTLGELFEHLIERHRHRCRGQGEELGDLHLAFLAPSSNAGRRDWFRVAQEELVGLVAEGHPDLASPRVSGGTLEDLEERGDHLYLGPHRVHVVVEAYSGRLDRRLFSSAMAGRTLVVNGPVDRVLTNKKCLALLSEQADPGGALDEAARKLVTDHIPWTRIVHDGYVDYCGERGFLPEVLEQHRERFVLKPALGMRGEGVCFGAATDEGRWRDLVDDAVDDEGAGWVVQELVPGRPRTFQLGEEGSALHDVVWGFFQFGRRYGGGFLRMLPRGGYGVVNAARGATESPIFVAAADAETRLGSPTVITRTAP